MKRKSVLLSVCLLTTLAITKIAYDAKVRPRAESTESPPAITTRLKPSPRAEVSPPAKPVPGITLYDRIEDAPSWTIRYGEEFWRKPVATPVTPQPNAAATSPEPGNFNLGDIIERVSNAIRPDDARAPKIDVLLYAARFGEQGFTISPKRFAGEHELAGNPEIPYGQKGGPRKLPIFEEDPSVAAEFTTLSVQSGEDLLFQGEDVAVSFLGNTGQRLLNESAGLIEHYQTRNEGVEVTWVLKERPRHIGPLEVRAQLTGLNYAGGDEDGHLFADSAGSPQVRVSHATLVDSAGQNFHISVEIAANQLTMSVPADILQQAQYPIALDPTIGPAMQIGWTLAANAQHQPSIAWNSTASAYLIVWSDFRNGSDLAPRWDVQAARVLSSGRLLDASGFTIASSASNGGSHQPAPRVASAGTDWMVVWRYFASSGTQNPATIDIYGRRVVSPSSLGSVIPICTHSAHAYEADVGVTAAGEYFVVWVDKRNSDLPYGGTAYQDDVFGARIPAGTDAAYPANGAVICPTGWRDGNNKPVERHAPRVHGYNNKYLVVWDGSPYQATVNGIYGNIITPDSVNNQLWSQSCPASLFSESGTNSLLPALARQGSEWLVVWRESAAIWGVRVSDSGVKVSSSRVAISSTSSSRPEIAASGSGYLVAWSTGNIRGARLNTGGTLLDSSGFDITTAEINEVDAALASDGSDYLVAWSAGPEPAPEGPEPWDLYATRVLSSAPKALDRLVISSAAMPHQQNPAVGSGHMDSGTPCFVAWEAYLSGNWDIMAARVNLSGWTPDLNGIAVATSAATEIWPTLALSRDETLVVWQNGGSQASVYGRVMRYDGSLEPTVLIRQPTPGYTAQLPSVAGATGSPLTPVNWLVVWEDTSLWYYGNGSFNIRGAIVTRSGPNLVVNASFQINDPASTGKRYPTVASDNTTYLVAWEDNSTADLHGKLVSTSGSAGSQFTVASDSYNTLKYPAAAGRALDDAVGQGFVVVWEDRPYTGSDPANIRGVPVSNTGQVGTKAFISSGSAGETGPAIASNGGDSYLVAWTDERNSTLDIYASRVNVVSGSPDTLSILDSSGLAINTDVSAQTKVAIGITRPYEPYAVAYDHAPAGLTAIRVNLVTP